MTIAQPVLIVEAEVMKSDTKKLRNRQHDVAKANPVLFQVGSKMSSLLILETHTEFDELKAKVVAALRDLAGILEDI